MLAKGQTAIASEGAALATKVNSDCSGSVDMMQLRLAYNDTVGIVATTSQ